MKISNKKKNRKWKIGDHYIDCGYIPRVVVEVHYEMRYVGNPTPDNYEKCQRRLFQEGLAGRSLIDGTIGNCSIHYCGVEWMHKTIAERWAKVGPLNAEMRKRLEDFYDGEWGDCRNIWWKK